jgi:hypothetical protein
MALSRRLEERRGAVLRLLKPTAKKTYKFFRDLRGVKFSDLRGVRFADMR